MTTTLFAVDTDGHDRALTRLLMTAEGRGAAVRGASTVDGGRTALLWLAHRDGRVAEHLLRALRRPPGCLAVTALPLLEAPRPVRHRVHVSRDVVDVVLELDVGGHTVAAASDGASVAEATTRAVAACTGRALGDVRAWLTAHPLTGRPVAVARTQDVTVAAAGATPEGAVLSALLVLPADRFAQAPALAV